MSLAHLQARNCAEQGFEGCSFSRKVRYCNDASYSTLHGSKQWSFYSASELLPITPIPTMLLSRRHTLHKERSVSQKHVVHIPDRLEIHRVHTSAFPYPRLAFFTVSLFSDRNFYHRSAFVSMQTFITTIAKTLKHLAISFLDMLDEEALGNCTLPNAQQDKGSELTIIE